MTDIQGLHRFVQGIALDERWAELAESLTGCLPLTLRRLIARLRRRLLIQVEDGQARVQWIAGLETQELGVFAPDQELQLPGLQPGRHPDRPLRVELFLPESAVLRRRLALPAQVRANLAQVLRYELDRLSPFRPEDAVFDFRVLPGPKAAERIQIELALCRRDRIEPWLGRLADLGAPVKRIAWAGAWKGANLLPPERRPRPQRIYLRGSAILGLTVALLLGIALIGPLWQREQLVQRLDGELKRVRTQALEVERVRQELEQVRQGNTAAIERKLNQPKLLELLRELTERLPEDTWVQNLEFGPEQIEIRGESGQASALIALLEQSPLIEGVAFASPVTQIARSGKERFNIAFHYEAGGQR